MTESHPLVSVVIPAYNRQDLIRRTIESVVAQDYPNIEIIVVDDCSKDNTESVIREYGNRIVYHRHERNMGAPATRNTGLKASRGEFVAFLDSDDTWLHNKISSQVELMLSSGRDTVLVYTGMLKVTEDGKVIGKKVPKIRGRIFSSLLKDNVIGSTSIPLLRKDAVLEVGGFDENLPSRQDLDLWLRLARNWLVDYVPGHLVNYYIHENRISSNIKAKITGSLMILDKYFHDMKKHPSILSFQYEVIGWLYKKDGQYEKAREYFIKSVRTFPNLKSLYRLLQLSIPLKD